MKRVSIVVPCYNEEAVFPYLRKELTELTNSLSSNYAVELVLVDDGSKDSTWNLVREFQQEEPRVVGVSLSRNFGHQAALSCGYEFASGDCIISMDADLQDPPSVVPAMLKLWEDGFDVVLAVRRKRYGESRFKLWTASGFYRVARWLGGLNMRPDCGDFRLMSRRSLDALTKLKEYHRFVRGMVGWVGFRTTEMVYDRPPRREGETKYPIGKMLRFALDGIFSFSFLPLRFAFIAGLILSAGSIGYLAYTIVEVLLFGQALVRGWSSLLLLITAFGAMNLICIGIVGEYVGRIFEEVKRRPLYLIQEVLKGQS
jgi:polyisoprenyl-phosphate glycosyltransferase